MRLAKTILIALFTVALAGIPVQSEAQQAGRVLRVLYVGTDTDVVHNESVKDSLVRASVRVDLKPALPEVLEEYDAIVYEKERREFGNFLGNYGIDRAEARAVAERLYSFVAQGRGLLIGNDWSLTDTSRWIGCGTFVADRWVGRLESAVAKPFGVGLGAGETIAQFPERLLGLPVAEALEPGAQVVLRFVGKSAGGGGNGKQMVGAFCFPYGNGRVYYQSILHDPSAPQLSELLVGGLRWAVGAVGYAGEPMPTDEAAAPALTLTDAGAPPKVLVVTGSGDNLYVRSVMEGLRLAGLAPSVTQTLPPALDEYKAIIYDKSGPRDRSGGWGVPPPPPFAEDASSLYAYVARGGGVALVGSSPCSYHGTANANAKWIGCGAFDFEKTSGKFRVSVPAPFGLDLRDGDLVGSFVGEQLYGSAVLGNMERNASVLVRVETGDWEGHPAAPIVRGGAYTNTFGAGRIYFQGLIWDPNQPLFLKLFSQGMRWTAGVIDQHGAPVSSTARIATGVTELGSTPAGWNRRLQALFIAPQTDAVQRDAIGKLLQGAGFDVVTTPVQGRADSYDLLILDEGRDTSLTARWALEHGVRDYLNSGRGVVLIGSAIAAFVGFDPGVTSDTSHSWLVADAASKWLGCRSVTAYVTSGSIQAARSHPFGLDVAVGNNLFGFVNTHWVYTAEPTAMSGNSDLVAQLVTEDDGRKNAAFCVTPDRGRLYYQSIAWDPDAPLLNELFLKGSMWATGVIDMDGAPDAGASALFSRTR